MKKRVLTAILWFYAVWYGISLWSLVAVVPDSVGPALCLVIAAVIFREPLRVLVGRTLSPQATPSAASLETDAA